MSIEFKRAIPDEKMYPHYNSMMNAQSSFQAPSGAIINISVNATGAEYSFYALSGEFSYNSSYNGDERGRKRRESYFYAVSHDIVKYPLQDKAFAMKEIFRVSDEIFDSGSDRRRMIDSRCLRRAYMMSALRSFAWTLFEYCKDTGKTPESVSIDELNELIDFIKSCNWLNYNDKSMTGICCGSDINIYFLPDSVPENIKNQLLPDEEDIEDEKRMMAQVPGYTPMLQEVCSLNKLREDLAYIYPAILAIYKSLKKDRDRSKPLEGDAADILFAWCALAYSADEPFLVTDGPTFFISDNSDDFKQDSDYEKVLYDGNVDTVELTVDDIFPIVASVEGTGYEGRNDRIENVKVGDKLIIKSDHCSEYYSPVAIEVFNSKGGSLGYIKDGYDSEKGISRLEAIDRFKDELTATVESVTPLSARRKNAKYALMDVKLSSEKLQKTKPLPKQSSSKSTQAKAPAPKAASKKEAGTQPAEQIAVVDDTWEVTIPSGYIYCTDKSIIKDHRNIIIMQDRKKNHFEDPFSATESFTSMVRNIEDAPLIAAMNANDFIGNGNPIITIKNTNDLYVAYTYFRTDKFVEDGKNKTLDIFRLIVGAGEYMSVIQVFFNNSKKTREDQQLLVDKIARGIRLKGSNSQAEISNEQAVEDVKSALSEITSELEKMENELSGASEKLQKAEDAIKADEKRHEEQQRKLVEARGKGAKADELAMFVSLLIEKSVGKIRRGQNEFYNLYSEDFPDLSKSQLIELRKTTVPKMNDNKFVQKCNAAFKAFSFEQRYRMLTLNAFNVALSNDPNKAKEHALNLSKDYLNEEEITKASPLLDEEIDNIRETMKNNLLAFDSDWLDFSTAKEYLKFYAEDKFEDYDSKNVFHFKCEDGYCYIVLRVGYLYAPLNNMIPWFWGVSIIDIYEAANENPINDMTSGDGGKFLVEEATEKIYKAYGKKQDAPKKDTRSAPSVTEREGINKLKKMVTMAEDNKKLVSSFYAKAPQEYIDVVADMFDALVSLSNDVLIKFKGQSDEILLAYVKSNGIHALNSLYQTFSESSSDVEDLIAQCGFTASSSTSNQKPAASSSSSTSTSNSSGGCYVATCVYGSYDCPQVWTLRRFRDHTLAKTWYGRLFIAIYYAISPHIVKAFGKAKWFNRLWKPVLDRMVESFRRKGISDSFYNDINQ